VHGITGHNFETRHPSNDSDQVWFPLVKYFQRRRFLKKFKTDDDDGRQVMAIAKTCVHELVKLVFNGHLWNKGKLSNYLGLVWFMVFNSTFNNISVILWWSVLLVEETGGPRKKHRPVASH
jgi:hypothetical protein